MKSKINKSFLRKRKIEINVKFDIGQKNMLLINDFLVDNVIKMNDFNVNINVKLEVKIKNVKLQERFVINVIFKIFLSRSNKSRQNRLLNRKKNNKFESKFN